MCYKYTAVPFVLNSRVLLTWTFAPFKLPICPSTPGAPAVFPRKKKRKKNLPCFSLQHSFTTEDGHWVYTNIKYCLGSLGDVIVLARQWCSSDIRQEIQPRRKESLCCISWITFFFSNRPVTDHHVLRMMEFNSREPKAWVLSASQIAS